MSEWQPIETAPKDGCYLLAWLPFEGHAAVVRWDAHLKDWMWSGSNSYSPEDEPTHWMPLPEPPTGDN